MDSTKTESTSVALGGTRGEVPMTDAVVLLANSRVGTRCASCEGLRPLRLHLHELSLYCDLLANARGSGGKGSSAPATTGGIGKWLRFASQVEEVTINTWQFEEASLYCEPVAEEQDSDAEHLGSLATRLTRFVFFCNALEEAYRFSESTYDKIYADKQSLASGDKRLNSASMKAGAVLREYADRIRLPADFTHLVGNLDKVAQAYETKLSVRLERFGYDPTDVRYGLDLVRCLRNHVAHGTFPILDNPEYAWGVAPDLRNTAFNLLGQAIRVGAVSLQALLAVDNDGMRSAYHLSECEGDYGDAYTAACTTNYLLSLHREQLFGLNELDQRRWWDSLEASEA